MDGEGKSCGERVLLTDRNTLTLNTVLYVESFDEGGISLCTRCGRVVVEGRELKIESLSKETGEIRIVGTVELMRLHEDATEGKPRLFGRLFR